MLKSKSMNYVAQSYMYMLSDINIRASEIWTIIIKKIYDLRLNESTSQKPIHMLYKRFETQKSYFDFVISIKDKYCDELIEFIIIRGLYDIYKDISTDDTKLIFFKQISDIYIKTDSDKEMCIDANNKKNFLKYLEDKNINKLESLYDTLYHEILFLVKHNLC